MGGAVGGNAFLAPGEAGDAVTRWPVVSDGIRE